MQFKSIAVPLLRSARLTSSARGLCTDQRLTHLDGHNRARMVDISDKPSTIRMARASAQVELGPKVYASVQASLSSSGGSSKGDVLTLAQLAGIQAAKQTSTLIPLCHPVTLTHVHVTAQLKPSMGISILAEARTTGPTGVEMEAMTAASVAALTVYDMVKGVGKAVTIGPIRLEEKQGGKSGTFVRT